MIKNVLFWPQEDLKYQHLDLHWTFYWSCFIYLLIIAWRISINARPSSIILIFVTVIFEVFGSSSNLLLCLADHQIAASITDITLTSSWFCFCFLTSCSQIIFLFIESITFVHELLLVFSSPGFFSTLLIYNYTIALVFIVIICFDLISLVFFCLSVEFDYLCYLDHFWSFHGFFFQILNQQK